MGSRLRACLPVCLGMMLGLSIGSAQAALVAVAELSPANPQGDGDLITLVGSNSFDTDGLSFTYNWSQTAGPGAFIFNNSNAGMSLQ